MLGLIAVSLLATSPCPHPVRHSAPKLAFVRAHPCPATGKASTHCPGYVIDHIVPLCACGPALALLWVFRRPIYRFCSRLGVK